MRAQKARQPPRKRLKLRTAGVFTRQRSIPRSGAAGGISLCGASSFAPGGKGTKTPLGAAAPSPCLRLIASLHKPARRKKNDPALHPLRCRSCKGQRAIPHPQKCASALSESHLCATAELHLCGCFLERLRFYPAEAQVSENCDLASCTISAAAVGGARCIVAIAPNRTVRTDGHADGVAQGGTPWVIFSTLFFHKKRVPRRSAEYFSAPPRAKGLAPQSETLLRSGARNTPL